MKIFVNKDIKHFFLAIMVVLVNFLVLTEVLIWVIVSFLIDNVCNFDGLFFVFSQTKQNVGGCSVTD